MRLPWPLPRAVAWVVLAAASAPVALGAPPPVRRPAGAPPLRTAMVEPPSSSLGAPNHGRLVGGARLDDTRALRVYAVRAARDRRWGLPELVGLLDRGAERVAERHPGSLLGVGDLSQRGGGDISLHHSHQSGRDADVGFYALGAAGRPFAAPDFVAFGPDGRSLDGRGLRFDEARNWALVETWLTDPRARVTHLFVAEHLRARLLAFARRAGAPEALRTRAAFAMSQPRHAQPHDDHFHVRIACPPRALPGCVEWPVAHRPRFLVARGGKKRARPAARSAAARARPAPTAAAGARRGPPPAHFAARPPPALRPETADDELRPFGADVRDVAELFDEGGELKIVD